MTDPSSTAARARPRGRGLVRPASARVCQTPSVASPAFTLDTPRPADAPALARVHVRSWEAAYGHVLSGEKWFGQPAIQRREAQWTQMLAPGTTSADGADGAPQTGAPRATDTALPVGTFPGTPGLPGPLTIRIGRDADGTPVGFAVAGPSRDEPPVRELELAILYLDPEWFGTGLGAALIQATLGDAPASVWVAEDNPRAIRFYAKHGFALDGARKVEPMYEGLVDVRMIR